MGELGYILQTYLTVDISLKDKLIAYGYEDITMKAFSHYHTDKAIRVYLIDFTFIHCDHPVIDSENTLDTFLVIKNNKEATINLFKELIGY